MGVLRSVRINSTTDGSGDSTDTSAEGALNGFLYAIEWIDGDYADGVAAAISLINTNSEVDQTLLTLTAANVDKWYYPRTELHGVTGSGLSTYGYMLLNGIPQVVVSSGGAAKTGGIILYYFK